MNRRTPKIEKLLSKSTSQKSAPIALLLFLLLFVMHLQVSHLVIYHRTLPILRWPIRANRFAASRTSPDSCESFQGSRLSSLSQGPLNGGGFQTGGFPDLDLSFLFFLFCPFWDFPDFFRDFPDLLGDVPGIFPIRPFSSFSAY